MPQILHQAYCFWCAWRERLEDFFAVTRRPDHKDGNSGRGTQARIPEDGSNRPVLTSMASRLIWRT